MPPPRGRTAGRLTNNAADASFEATRRRMLASCRRRWIVLGGVSARPSAWIVRRHAAVRGRVLSTCRREGGLKCDAWPLMPEMHRPPKLRMTPSSVRLLSDRPWWQASRCHANVQPRARRPGGDGGEGAHSHQIKARAVLTEQVPEKRRCPVV